MTEENKIFYNYLSERFTDYPDIFKRETQLCDKIYVRKHLDTDFKEYLPEVYYMGHIRRSNFKKLPKSYVIKPRCCQDGKAITFVKDGINLATNKRVSPMEIKRFYTFLKSDRKLGKDVIIEELLFDKSAKNKIINEEYNFFVFGGITEYISVVKNINTNNRTTIDYDLEWNRLQLFTDKSAPLDYLLEKPDNLEEMIDIANRLGKLYSEYTTLPFARVDLYNTDQGIKFGEFTGDLNGQQNLTEEYQTKCGEYLTRLLNHNTN